MTDQGTIWLTQEAYDKLQAELDDLKGPKRQEIIEKIAAARDEGDLKENSGYHAAKDDQGKQEARIRQLGQSFDGEVGIAVREVDSGWTTSWNGDRYFPQQSVSKFWVALTAFRRVDAGELAPDSATASPTCSQGSGVAGDTSDDHVL